MTRTILVALSGLLLCSLPAAAQGKGQLTQTGKGYRWTRGSLQFELRDRHAKWKPADARKVELALDKLPNVLLRLATKSKVKTFYRDDVVRGRLGLKRKKASATTVFERGFVAYGNSLFTRSASSVYKTVTHELGHVAQYAITGKRGYLAWIQVTTLGTKGFTSISWTAAVTNGLKSYNGFVSTYARTGNREDFAESVEFYWINPAELRRVSPAKFRFMRDEVFEKLSSPASSRDLNHKAINPVRPRIEKLGDTADDPRSLVRIKGTRFMGPRDGGFNRVTYGSKRALRLAISRSQIWSWVPGLSPGSAPIAVTTQDGKSNTKPFTVKKAWWKFW